MRTLVKLREEIKIKRRHTLARDHPCPHLLGEDKERGGEGGRLFGEIHAALVDQCNISYCGQHLQKVAMSTSHHKHS